MRLSRQLLVSILIAALAALPVAANDDTAFKEIDRLIRMRDYSHAVEQLNRLAASNNPEASYRLAGLYRTGKGVDRNLDRAADLYRQAAEQGHVEAQFSLALLLDKSGSADEASFWYERAAAQGHKHALSKLAGGRRAVASDPDDIDPDAIFDAIRHNDEALIDRLIASGTSLDLTDAQGNSTLMVALLAGWPGLSATLLRHSSQLEQANLAGSRPIHVAAKLGYREIVLDLLERRVDPNRLDGRGHSALMIAAAGRDAELAQLLLELGADPGLVNDKGLSAADIAAINPQRSIAAVFSRYGIEPAARKPVPKTARTLEEFRTAMRQPGSRYAKWPTINAAIELGEADFVTQLLASKPNPRATDPDGNTALHIAARKGDEQTMKALLKHPYHIDAVNGRRETALYLATEAVCRNCVRLLISRGADPSIASSSAKTPLEIAVHDKRSEIITELLKSKVRYNELHRVLLIAIHQQQQTLALLLLPRDPQLEKLDDNQRSVLWHSADQGLEKLVAALLDKRSIDIDQTDSDGRGALAQAVFRGHLAIARKLVESGAGTRGLTRQGNTLLMLAVQSRNPAMVEYLLALGSDLNARNLRGDTALMRAAGLGHEQIVELLMTAGADLQLRNEENLNAYQIATNAGHPRTAKLIYDRSNFVFRLFN